jgi:PAS domain S-box-containing protein
LADVGDEVKRKKQLTTESSKPLLELVNSLSLAPDFESMLDTLLDHARRLVPCSGTSVLWLEEDHLNVLASDGETAPMPGLSLPANQVGAARPLLDSRQPVLVSDALADAHWQRVPGEEEVRSWLGAPLLFEDRTLGLIEWTAREPNGFGEQDRELAALVAQHAAPLLHRAQLLDDTRRRLREVAEPQPGATPKAVDFRASLQPVVLETQELTASRHAFLFLLGAQEDELRCVAAAGDKRADLARMVLRGDGTLGGWNMLPDGSPHRPGPTDREAMARLGIRHTLTLPLRVHGRLMGMLGAAEPHNGRAFGQDSLQVMTHLASQASLILERSYLGQPASEAAEYRTAVQSSPLGVGILSMAGEIRVCNPALAALFSRPERSLVGRYLQEFLVASDGRRITIALEEAAISGRRRNVDTRVRAAPGEQRHVRISLAQARISGQVDNTVVAIMENITSLKILERERVQYLRQLRERHEQLRDFDQLKSRFVSNVSHELRTPLAVIKLYATLAGKGRPEKQRHYLQTIEQETHRLETMVENILDLTRLDRDSLQIHPEWLPPNVIIGQVLGVYEETAQKRGIRMRQRAKEDLPAVWADRNHLVQMLTNLVDNALKYTPPGGQVWVAARARCAESEPVLEIGVGDTGTGIPQDERERVFDRFYRGSNNASSTTGTGLGLAIVQDLMQQHGGSVTLRSQEGRGSIFTLRFPLAELPPPLSESNQT